VFPHYNNAAGFFGLFLAESEIVIFRFRLETEKAINPINPYQIRNALVVDENPSFSRILIKKALSAL